MAKRQPAPAGLDYVPISGEDPDLIFGVVRSTLGKLSNSASQAVLRRLCPVGGPHDHLGPWPAASCYRSDIVLPAWAPNYASAQALCRDYDEQGWDGIKDLVLMVSFRFPATVSIPPTITLDMAYEEVRAFARERLCKERQMAAVLAFHVPGRAGSDILPPHVHVMALARTLGPDGFGAFVRPLTTDAGRSIIEREWAEWRAL